MSRIIVFDKHLNRQGDLDYSLVNEPVIIQDATSGQDTLHLGYPAENIRALDLTWQPYQDNTWEEVDPT